MHRAVNTVIFDLDGTVYQDTTFHRDYIRFLVADTPFAQWQDDLIQLVDGVFAGEHLTMNRFYEVKQVQARSAWELFCTLQQNLCPPNIPRSSAKQPAHLPGDAGPSSPWWARH